MKIEFSKIPIKLTDSNISNSQRIFNEGDIINARIISKEGDLFTLKTDEGLLFSAKMMDIDPQINSVIELVVNQELDNKYIMQIQNNKLNDFFIEFTESDKAEIQISQILNRINIEPSSEIVNKIINIIQNNTAIDIRTAVFFAVNNIPASDENILIVNDFISGENLDKQLAALISEFAPERLNKPPDGLNDLFNSDKILMDLASQTDIAFEPKTIAANNINTNITEKSNVMQPKIEVMTNLNIDDNLYLDIETMDVSKREIPKQGTSDTRQEVLIENSNINQNAANNQTMTINKILSKVFSLFVKLPIADDEISTLLQEQKTDEKFINLKELVLKSDIKNKKSILDKTDKIIANNRFADDIKRFNFYNILFDYNNQKKAAELYVKKQPRQKRNHQKESFVLLISLDTQNIGKIETLIRAEEKKLSLYIKSDNTDAIAFIKQKSLSLSRKISDYGYYVSEIKVEELLYKTTLVNADEVLSFDNEVNQYYMDIKI